MRLAYAEVCGYFRCRVTLLIDEIIMAKLLAPELGDVPTCDKLRRTSQVYTFS